VYSEVRKANEEAGDGFSVSGVLKHLKVSKSGYYDWLDRILYQKNLQERKHKISVRELDRVPFC